MLGVSYIIASKNRLAELVAEGKLSVEDYFSHSINTKNDVVTLMQKGNITIGPEGGENTTVANWTDDTNQTMILGMEAYGTLLDEIYPETKEQTNV